MQRLKISYINLSAGMIGTKGRRSLTEIGRICNVLKVMKFGNKLGAEAEECPLLEAATRERLVKS
jgi:hypothetical protein